MENISYKLPFGLRDGRILTIHEVDSGLACNCVCPNCETKLVAKKGQNMSHHFAHYSADCGKGRESALHLMAKQVLMESKFVQIPALFIDIPISEILNYDNRDGKDFLDFIAEKHRDKSILAIHATRITADSAREEVTVGNIRPDVVFTIKGTDLHIEPAVTHFSEAKKIQYLKENNISSFEIDLSEYYNVNFDKAAVETLVTLTAPRKWINNAKYNEYKERILKKRYDSIKSEYILHKSVFEKERLIEEKLRAEYEKKEKWKAEKDEKLRLATEKASKDIDKILKQIDYDAKPISVQNCSKTNKNCALYSGCYNCEYFGGITGNKKRDSDKLVFCRFHIKD